MNKKEFFEEVKASPICPENFDFIYQKFLIYQSLAWETLKEFCRICKLYDINYQLAYGTLLGAVRDNGPIPWDYDVDVFVSYDDREKLVNALSADLNNEYYFYCVEKDINCRHFSLRITPKGYKSEILHVDVFFYIGSPNSKKERLQFAKNITSLSYKRFYNLLKPIDNSCGNLKSAIVLSARKARCLFYAKNKLLNNYIIECSKYPVKDSEYCVSADIYSCKYEFKKDYFFNTTLKNTIDGEFLIPKAYKELLVMLYGDYWLIPSLSNRIQNIINTYRNIEYFDKNF